MRLATILTGSFILVLSVLAMFILGRFLNPAAQQVFVAAGEIQAGEYLTPERVRLASVRLPDTAPYVTADDIERYGYAQVVEPIHDGMFIPKAALSFAGNPAAAARVSLSLADPDLAAMTIPVTPLTSPSNIVPGDRVSLNVSVGSVPLMSGSLTSNSSGSNSGNLAPLQGYPAGNNPFGMDVTPQPSSTPEPRLSLPVTKNLVVSGRVLEVVREERFTAAAVPGQNPAAPAERGKLQALVVAVPRSVQEALAFAIASGEVRVAVLDPNAPDEVALTAGMSWDDLVAYFRWQRQEWLLTPQPLEPINPPGAADLLPTLMATYYPSPTPERTQPPGSGSSQTETQAPATPVPNAAP
jgi:hypothetical protein